MRCQLPSVMTVCEDSVRLVRVALLRSVRRAPDAGIGDQPVDAVALREDHLARLAAFDPGEQAPNAPMRRRWDAGHHVVVDAIQLDCAAHRAGLRLPQGIADQRAVPQLRAVAGDVAFGLIEGPAGEKRRIDHSCRRVLRQDSHVLHIDHAVAEGSRADIADRVVRPETCRHDPHLVLIDLAVAVEVHDRVRPALPTGRYSRRCLPRAEL